MMPRTSASLQFRRSSASADPAQAAAVLQPHGRAPDSVKIRADPDGAHARALRHVFDVPDYVVHRGPVLRRQPAAHEKIVAKKFTPT